MVRHYDRVNFKTTVPIRPFKTKWLEGLTIFYHLLFLNPSHAARLSLTDRGHQAAEFVRISQQPSCRPC